MDIHCKKPGIKVQNLLKHSFGIYEFLDRQANDLGAAQAQFPGLSMVLPLTGTRSNTEAPEHQGVFPWSDTGNLDLELSRLAFVVKRAEEIPAREIPHVLSQLAAIQATAAAAQATLVCQMTNPRGGEKTGNVNISEKWLTADEAAALLKVEETDRIIPWVFHRRGKPIKNFYKAWRSACKAAGVPGRILHDFRRTAVRNLERAGVPRSDAMAIVGHQTESIYRRYAISDEASLRESADKLDVLHVEQSAGTTTRRQKPKLTFNE
jgi:hypothetical protein